MGLAILVAINGHKARADQPAMTHADADVVLAALGQWCKRYPGFKFGSLPANQVLQAIIVEFEHAKALSDELHDYGEHLMVLAGLYEAMPGADKEARSYLYARQVGDLLVAAAKARE